MDFPAPASDLTASGGRQSGDLEGALRSGCRVELPGIYFAFNSAVLDPASDRTIAALAEVLGRHPDWIATIEGHTDSIGTSAANQTLSEQRAAAVRERLVGPHKVDPNRLSSAGYGSGKPRESNETIEGGPATGGELVRRSRRPAVPDDCSLLLRMIMRRISLPRLAVPAFWTVTAFCGCGGQEKAGEVTASLQARQPTRRTPSWSRPHHGRVIRVPG